MDVEEVVERILASRPDLTRDEVLRMIEEKASKTGPAMSMLSAALSVARELGVKIDLNFEPGTQIGKLVTGLSDVTVTGRIMSLRRVRKFRRRDGRTGKMASMVIADETGSVRVVLWDEKAELVESGELEVGQVVQVAHAYTREGLGGRLELHVGPRGSVLVNPPGVDESKYPSPFPEPIPICEISPEERQVSVEGFVLSMRALTKFRRPDGSEGKVLRLVLADETGSVPCVLWDDAAEACEDLEVGSRLKLLGARVRESLTGKIELHVERASQIEILPGRAELPPGEMVKVAELTPGQPSVNLLVKVLRVGGIRELRTGRVATLVVADETGSVRLDLWDDKAELAGRIRPGDVLLVRNASVRERRGKIMLSLGRTGSLEVNPEGLELEVPSVTEAELKALGEITGEGGPYTVEVVIETAPELREVVTSRGERVAVASTRVSDGTGEMRLSVWRDLADQLVALPVGTRIRVHNVWAKEGPFGLELTSGVDSFIEVVEEPGGP